MNIFCEVLESSDRAILFFGLLYFSCKIRKRILPFVFFLNKSFIYPYILHMFISLLSFFYLYISRLLHNFMPIFLFIFYFKLSSFLTSFMTWFSDLNSSYSPCLYTSSNSSILCICDC